MATDTCLAEKTSNGVLSFVWNQHAFCFSDTASGSRTDGQIVFISCSSLCYGHVFWILRPGVRIDRVNWHGRRVLFV